MFWHIKLFDKKWDFWYSQRKRTEMGNKTKAESFVRNIIVFAEIEIRY